ncbi:hypothetical protein EVAR_81145_1 [Eumeta japonica]|uniref:Uncharacterized protein n=1 Tax=Eumeta variegata TaxID=151549 RepID=A0A4C1UKV0_EUMVA|nr:hypothetical protein EVAR_81145_1 [Eumeta japonica]
MKCYDVSRHRPGQIFMAALCQTEGALPAATVPLLAPLWLRYAPNARPSVIISERPPPAPPANLAGRHPARSFIVTDAAHISRASYLYITVIDVPPYQQL